MPRNGPIFQTHHGIEQQTLKTSSLLLDLAQQGKFNIHADENLILLPADRGLARDLGITAHNGGPIADYQKGLLANLRRLEETADWQAAVTGEPEATTRMVGRVELLRDTIRLGLINGDLYTNAPAGLVADDVRSLTQRFFLDAQTYSPAHAEQLRALRAIDAADAGWAAVVQSESRIISTLQFVQTNGDALTKGGEIGLQPTLRADPPGSSRVGRPARPHTRCDERALDRQPARTGEGQRAGPRQPFGIEPGDGRCPVRAERVCPSGRDGRSGAAARRDVDPAGRVDAVGGVHATVRRGGRGTPGACPATGIATAG